MQNLSKLLLGVFACLACLDSTSSLAREPKELLSSPLAAAFGATPILWGAELSPDGSRISAIQMHPSGTTILTVIDLNAGTSSALMAGERDEHDISWCDWANDTYLLCGLKLLEEVNHRVIPTTRLISISTETAEIRELIDRMNEEEWQQYQDRVVDWMPDDPEHVLIQRREDNGYGVARINILTGKITTVEPGRSDVYSWMTDGHGTARLYQRTLDTREEWFARSTPQSDWRSLHERELKDLDAEFNPIGFGEDRNELLYFDRHEGRWAIFAMNLADGDSTRLVYANPGSDVTGLRTFGKYSRVVAASYADELAQYHFFDDRAATIYAALGERFPGMLVDLIDEDWNRRHYLVFVSSAEDPGAYYRYDAENGGLLLIARAYPTLEGRELIPMTPLRYASSDGTMVPAYLTAPPDSDGAQAAVILPHGGPSSRDYWSYDFLAQFLAANGYVVLQSNYRGSGGYGESWEGDGGFQDWPLAVADLQAGFDYLVDQGIADKDRICTVGWSYGGYAAVMSAIENPNAYRCVVSIAGVTDPRGLADYESGFVGGLSARAFIGEEDDVLKQGAPIERAGEISVPVLLFQGQKDVNVPATQASAMARALRSAKADYELIEYDYAEHSIRKPRYRTDLLSRLALFLSENLEGGD
jgi:dipeptidyl aminopeptidase/acylaminoacyl peptidase